MNLIVVRHAPAVERSSERPDSERSLTERGKRRFARCVRGLERHGVRIGVVFSSPFLRAVETAELLAPIAAADPELTELLARSPSEELLGLLALRGGDRPAVVGHEPWLGELVAWLVAGRREIADGFALRKGGVASLVGDPRPGRMALDGFWAPRLLRTLSRRR